MILSFKKFLYEWGVSTIVCFLLYDLVWLLADFIDFKEFISPQYYINLLIDFVLCASFSLISILLSHKILKRTSSTICEVNYKNLIISGVLLLLANLLIAACLEVVFYVVDLNFFEDGLWGNCFLFGLIASQITLFHLLIHYSKNIIKNKEANITLQKRYLKLQLDPHFVFNSLASLVGMISLDPPKAEKYAIKLSHIYRHILNHIDNDYITLADAKSFAEEYVDMLNLRYDNHIVLHTNLLNNNEKEYILSLSLQLLIENAVKHNPPSLNVPLHICILKQENVIIVRNNRIDTTTPNDSIYQSYHLGLENLTKRYLFETKLKPSIICTEKLFEVKLPIIRK